ncbi:GNAT family N-acetyltransferase [Flavicella sediminum]|uniref:GNAT family N-acetyltransferase n=1 Tax=Flavicella sediminum TaxID=2585141 RepID=UPI001120CA47|nr:GNAT family N-acetyltransferase [Flavicella sediminum]
MNFTIRKALVSDMKAVHTCICELAHFEKESDAVEVTVKDLERDGFGENPLFEVFVGLVDEEIVGIALFYYRYSTWKGKTIHLEDLIVKEAFRGKGIGKGLYNKVLAYGVQLGLKRIEWNVLDWNTNAVKFYESTGAKILDDWQVVQMDAESLKKYVESL